MAIGLTAAESHKLYPFLMLDKIYGLLLLQVVLFTALLTRQGLATELRRVVLTLHQPRRQRWVQGTESLSQKNTLHCGLMFLL